MDENRLAFLALHFIPGIGHNLIKQLISYTGSADAVFKTPKGKLLKIPGIGDVTAESIIRQKSLLQAEKEFSLAEKQQVQIHFYTDKSFPSRLKQLPDAPTLLYSKGKINFESNKTVAIIGTRKATQYGKEMVDLLTKDLVKHDPLIVSGLAYGIDIHAHKKALQYELNTIAIMGSGIDIIYPAAHKDTVNKMLNYGGIVTENHFGTAPDAHRFPERNRIIAGLADAVIVIEAAAKGGALITADIANSYNKDVFAIPGNIGQPTSEGCNKLIKTNQAHLINSVADLEYIMGWDKISNSKTTKQTLIEMSSFSEDEQLIIKAMIDLNKSIQIDELSWRVQVPVHQLAAILLNLEFKGAVQSLPGKQYKLSHS
jgi:DNA processing protein